MNARNAGDAAGSGAISWRQRSADVARYLLILAAIMLYPIYRLWIAGGAICDARDRKRR